MPQARILLVEILPSGVTTEKSAEDASVNRALEAEYRGRSTVRCMDLSSLFLKHGVLNTGLFYDPRLTTPRGALYPDTEGPRLMAKALSAALYETRVDVR